MDKKLIEMGSVAKEATKVTLVTPPPSIPVPLESSDWRQDLNGITPKLNYILTNGQFADVSFRLADEEDDTVVEIVEAHKLILVINSPVFEAMFNGSFSESGNSAEEPVDVTDIAPTAFKAMLKFIYTGTMSTTLSTSDLLLTLYAATKYGISELETVCSLQIKKRISVENVVSIFEAVQVLGNKELNEKCYKFIQLNFDKLMGKEQFCNFSMENLCLLLADDETCIPHEFGLFIALTRWAQEECTKQELEICPENQRQVLGDALAEIRFPLMTAEEIALKVIPTQILTLEESMILLQHKCVSEDKRGLLPRLGFYDEPRRHSILYTACFYDEKSRPFDFTDYSYEVRFKVSHPVSIVGFGFYGPGPSYTDAKFKIDLKLVSVSTSTVVGDAICGLETTAKSDTIFHVDFQRGVPIQPDTEYKVDFWLKGPPIPYGCRRPYPSEKCVAVNCSPYSVKFTYTINSVRLPQIKFRLR